MIRNAAFMLAACIGLYSGGAQAQLFAPNPDWNGVYFGGQIGLLAIKAHEMGSAIPAGEALLGDTGGSAGVFVGFHHQLNDWLVWGLDAEFNLDSTEYFYNGSPFGALQWDGTVRLVLGVPVAPNVLAYGTVGYSMAHFDLSPYYTTPGTMGHIYTSGGPQLGLGTDIMITDTMMARFHATWALYGVHSITDGGGTVIGTSEPSHVNVRVGLGWAL